MGDRSQAVRARGRPGGPERQGQIVLDCLCGLISARAAIGDVRASCSYSLLEERASREGVKGRQLGEALARLIEDGLVRTNGDKQGPGKPFFLALEGWLRWGLFRPEGYLLLLDSSEHEEALAKTIQEEELQAMAPDVARAIRRCLADSAYSPPRELEDKVRVLLFHPPPPQPRGEATVAKRGNHKPASSASQEPAPGEEKGTKEEGAEAGNGGALAEKPERTAVREAPGEKGKPSKKRRAPPAPADEPAPSAARAPAPPKPPAPSARTSRAGAGEQPSPLETLRAVRRLSRSMGGYDNLIAYVRELKADQESSGE